MKKFLCRFVFAMCVALTYGYAQRHEFTVRDDIEMVRFSDPSESEKDAEVKFSHDGKYFAVVTSKGLIDSDQIESTLSIFRTAESAAYVSFPGTTNAPRPTTSIKIATVLVDEQSDSYGSVITDLRWSSESQDLYFLAEGRHGNRRLYRVNADTGRETALTPEDHHVVRFDFTQNAVVCSVWRSDPDNRAIERDEIGDQINADARVVTGESLNSILFPHSQPRPTDRKLWLLLQDHGRLGGTTVHGPLERDISWLPEAFAISPKGHMLVQLRPLAYIPTGWDRYAPAKGYEWLRIRSDDPNVVAANNLWRLKEYSLVNLDNGNSIPLVNAPQGYALIYSQDSKAHWSPDERALLLTNTFLPLDGVDVAEQNKRLKPCVLAFIRLPSRENSCIMFLSDLADSSATSILTDSLKFGMNDNEVRFRIKLSNGSQASRRYVFTGGRWQLLGTDPSARVGAPAEPSGIPNDLKVIVKQELNESPTLWATNITTGRSKKLWDPNPQFAHLQFGKASVYHWKGKDGYTWTGGLVKPVGYIPGKRYPLVIQIYNFSQDQFLTDGLFPTAMAARHLASAGIVALQVQRKLPHSFDDAEGDAQLSGIESAIDQLAEEGLVDPQKVGLVGFSATCWYVEHALIMSPNLFRAATIADGVDISYMQYRLFGVSSPTVAREYEEIVGSKPLGYEGLKQWIARAPGFNLDKITTPVRLEGITPGSLLAEWEIYSSLKMQGKPVDLIYFPDGQHIHQKPLERLASQQGDVDWFRFWLQGYVDPDPEKRNQYKRWEKMRDQNAMPNTAH